MLKDVKVDAKDDREPIRTESPAEKAVATSPWRRSLYMLLFALIYSLVETVVFLVAIVALLFRLFGRTIPARLLGFGAELSFYAQQIIQFLTFNSEAHPFPFTAWPTRQGRD